VQIALKKHPSSLFTPQIPSQTFYLPIKTILVSIRTLISRFINITKDAIRLYVCSVKVDGLVEIGGNLKLEEVN